MWMPIMVFFYMTFEHSVVNMFLFPSGLMLGAHFTVMDYLFWNEIPTVLGNLVGGLVVHGPDALRDARAREARAEEGLADPKPRRLRRGSHSARYQRSDIARPAFRQGPQGVNQDFHGACVPDEPLLSAKGIAIALADGISRATSARSPAKSAVKSFLDGLLLHLGGVVGEDSAQRVLTATNSWLHAQTRKPVPLRPGPRLRLHASARWSSRPHRTPLPCRRRAHLPRCTATAWSSSPAITASWVSREQSYLARALGVDPHVEIDYRALPLEAGDMFVLATDGVYEHVAAASRCRRASRDTPTTSTPRRARIVDEAYESGSADNLTVQIVRVDALPRRASRRAPQAPSCRRRRFSRAHGLRRLPHRARAARAAPQPHLPRARRRRPTRRSSSRRRRSTCATTRPTWSAF